MDLQHTAKSCTTVEAAWEILFILFTKASASVIAEDAN
jgi:hypothetical protein